MPYILSRPVHPALAPQWGEGAPYQKLNIYDGCESTERSVPPVHYDAHTLRPHSLTHADAPAHIDARGATIDQYFKRDAQHSPFWGRATVVQIPVRLFKEKVCRLSLADLQAALQAATGQTRAPDRLLLSAQGLPEHAELGHPPDWPLVLSREAAEWLAGNKNFVLYGTSWKSTDYEPGSRDRPIHRIVFERALIFECLDLTPVPPGEYFWVGMPLWLVGASESPACPILFRKDELNLE
jgi:arylformamidase